MAELKIGTVRFKDDLVVKYISPIGVYPATDSYELVTQHISDNNINILQLTIGTGYNETIGEWEDYNNFNLIESIDFYNENDEKLNTELFSNNYESRIYSVLFRVNPTDNIGDYNKIQARIKYRENSTDTDYLTNTSSYVDIKNPINIITPLPNLREYELNTEYPFEFEYTTVYLNKLNLEFSDYWIDLDADDYHFRRKNPNDDDALRNPFISDLIVVSERKLGLGSNYGYIDLGMSRRLRMNIRFSDRQTTNINLNSGTEEEPKTLNLYNNYAPIPPYITKVTTDTNTVIIGESFDFNFYGVGELQGITKLELYNTNNELINCEFGDIPNFNLNSENYYPISCTITQENINENDSYYLKVYVTNGTYKTFNQTFKVFNEQNTTMDAPIIKTLSQSINELPSGGGSVEINVEYENYDIINTPSIYIDGEEKDYSLYLSPKSIMAGDIYNYVFDFPATTKEQIISITLSAYLEEEETRQSYLITQNAPTGNPDIDNPEIKSELILSRYADEVNNNSQEYYVNSLINIPLNEEVGEVRATVSVDWLVVENDGGGVNDFPYYKELQNEWYIGIEQNNNEESRLAEITFGYYDINGNLVDSKKLMLLQNGTLRADNKEYYSVWEDIIFETDEDIFNYEVVMSVFNTNGLSNNTTIFEGRAYKYPDADTIKIKLNKIFENYLSNSFVNLINDYNIDDIINTSFNTDKYNYESCKRFYIINRDTNELLGEYVVLYDWSYKLKWRGEDIVLSKPINNNNAVNQINLNTTVNTVGIVTNNITNENKINSCGDYAVYYLNSYGGWDTLLFNNKVNKSKNINYYTTEKYFRKPNIDFEQYRYISELQNSYELNTNFLTDIESQNIVDNLFVSNEVYLHNLKNNELFAVIITNTNIDYKVYSDGLELPQYTINVKESQIQLKR